MLTSPTYGTKLASSTFSPGFRPRSCGSSRPQRLFTGERDVISLNNPLDKPRLRFCLRATVNALLAFGLAHAAAVPLHGLWAVPTAVVVMQMSIGGSLKAATD